jgi:hypothetical protein
MVGEVARVEDNLKFIRKFRDSQGAFLVQRCRNSHGNYLANEEFSSGGWRGFIIIPRAKNK